MAEDTSNDTNAVNDDNPHDSNLLPALTLVLGGARSGKSHHAETLIAGHLDASDSITRPTYIATAEAGDGEMVNRIADHRARRGDRWHTVETLLALADTIVAATSDGQPALVDCLTLWLSNAMHAELDLDTETSTLLDAFTHANGPVVCVSNEVGLGIVPDNALARAFRDAAGRLNQQVAAQADRVDFVAAGIPITLKNELS